MLTMQYLTPYIVSDRRFLQSFFLYLQFLFPSSCECLLSVYGVSICLRFLKLLQGVLRVLVEFVDTAFWFSQVSNTPPCEWPYAPRCSISESLREIIHTGTSLALPSMHSFCSPEVFDSCPIRQHRKMELIALGPWSLAEQMMHRRSFQVSVSFLNDFRHWKQHKNDYQLSERLIEGWSTKTNVCVPFLYTIPI